MRYPSLLLCTILMFLLCSNNSQVQAQFPCQGRFWVPVAPGTKSPQVTVIQYLLRSHGYKLVVDGSFGSQTKSRIQTFQVKNGLKETSVVDEATWEELVVTVKKGSKGDAVRAAQTMLKAYWKGFDNPDYRKVIVDGVYGAQTERQIKKFQQQEKRGGSYLPAVDGIVGKSTWAILTANEH